MKRNKRKLLEKLVILQRQLRELQRTFYVEFGMAVEKELHNGNSSTEKIVEIYERLKREFGM